LIQGEPYARIHKNEVATEAAGMGSGSLAGHLLSFEGITKRFGGTTALRNVSLHLDAGEILALLGENGAGKSTLIKSLAGIHVPDEGRILFNGEPYHHAPPMPHEKQRVAFIHQDLGLLEWMTVAENVGLAQGYSRRNGFISWRDTERRAAEALTLVGCDFDPTRRVQDLSRTEKSLVAIARALAVEADVLVLDEPTASLPADEVERLFAVLRKLRARGVGMIYVSHRLDEIFRIADRVAVLRDGRLVGEQAVKATTPSQLVSQIVGREVKDLYVRAPLVRGRETLEVSDLVTFGAGPVNFAAHQGEVLGLVGLRGAGQEAIGRALFGAQHSAGEVRLDGQPLSLASPEAALAQGIGLVARDRTEESVAASLSIRENVFINPLAIGRGIFSFLSPSAEAERAADIGRDVGLRPNDPSLPVEALSGGNQQKIVVGRWLATGRRVLIAEDPTAGVDVGAKADIYRLIVKALQSGLTVIVVSTDFEEVAHICHRALVFSRGAIVAEIGQDRLTTESLIHAASASEAA
jgi:ribose transport system ATP-binding protein